jgi:hypothetical protein
MSSPACPPAARPAGIGARDVTTRDHHSFRKVTGATPTASGWLAAWVADPPCTPEPTPTWQSRTIDANRPDPR